MKMEASDIPLLKTIVISNSNNSVIYVLTILIYHFICIIIRHFHFMKPDKIGFVLTYGPLPPKKN